ncbi:MAG: Stk1 family PASTA domain-containing Ser/Thr kinase [Actinobacteria bacterium]|nr:Stk1 family PASTA domain-containing Ser/Thr kinase [Actinomycetota bacterium]
MQRTVIDNRYTLVEPLGGGGMAEVYLAHDDVLDREVALKILRNQYANDEEFVERFRREAQSAAKLSHPNIVSIYDRGRSEDGAYYIAMEHVQRGTLKDRIKRDGALAPDVATGVALQIADALQAAHENGVIHRDIKPQNVLVSRTGDVKVTDFGIARAASSPLTQTSAVLGTAGYMSPEQAMGKPVGPQSDLYSLGVVLFEMLTGELPYDAESPISLALKHVNEPPRSPREANPEVSEPLDAITLKLLAKNPENRYASAAELADDLERVRSGLPPAAAGMEKTAPLAPPPTSPGERTARTAVRAPVAPTPRVPGRGGRRGGPSRALAALFFGLVLLIGLAWALTSFLLPQDDSGSESENQSETPVAEEPTTVLVPDLLWASTAAADLGRVGLNLGAVEEVPNNTFLAGQVIETNPFEGTEAEVGSTVDMTVSTGPVPDPQSAPAPLPAPQPAAVQQPDPDAVEEAADDKEEAREARKEDKEDKKGKGNKKGKN